MGSSKEKEYSQARQTKKENYLDQALIARTKVTAVAPYGGSGRASIALSQNIASPKQPNLFDGIEITTRDERINIERKSYTMERDGKPVWLSNLECRLVMLLSSTINVTEEDVAQWIGWTEAVEAAGKLTDDDLNTMPNPIARTYKLRDLAQSMFGGTKKRQIDAVRKMLRNLQTTIQKQILGKSKQEVIAPIINLDWALIDNSEDEEKPDRSTERVVFGSIFLWNIGKRFGLLTPKLFEVWGKKGNGTETELFSALLTTLLAIHYHHQRAAIEARIEVRKEFEERQVSEDEKNRILNERVTEALTYRETFSHLKSKITTDYDSKKQYRAKFKSDLTKAVNALVEIGLITKGYFSKGKRGDDMANFIINEDYRKLNLLPPVDEA